jgi:hypothetical protein
MLGFASSMNPNTIPCGATQALDLDQARQAAAEERYERDLAMYPLEDFREKALCNLADETGFEVLLQLRELAPTSMLVILLRGLGKESLLLCNGYGLSVGSNLLGAWLEDWVATEQERLQAEAIEASR